MVAFQITACNNGNGEDPTAPTEEAPTDNNDTPAEPDNSPEQAPAEEPAATPAPEAPTPAEPSNTPVAEKSPMEITRIPPAEPNYSIPTVTGSDELPPVNDPEEAKEEDPHEHEPAPNLFPVDQCQVEINGYYDSKFSKELVDAINEARKDYMIGEVTRNTSLLACADIRCKEQSYFVGHFRPNGSSWQSVAPGYVQGECIAVDYRKAADVVEAWLSVNKTRVQLMNPEYTQIGTSVYNINGTLFIAAEFGY